MSTTQDMIQEWFIRGKNMQSVMEVYNLSMDMQKQLNRHRCFEY